MQKGWIWTVIDRLPPDNKRNLVRVMAESPVGTVREFEFYDDWTPYISMGDKVK